MGCSWQRWHISVRKQRCQPHKTTVLPPRIHLACGKIVTFILFVLHLRSSAAHSDRYFLVTSPLVIRLLNHRTHSLPLATWTTGELPTENSRVKLLNPWNHQSAQMWFCLLCIRSACTATVVRLQLHTEPAHTLPANTTSMQRCIVLLPQRREKKGS